MPLALCCMSHSPLLDITEQDPDIEHDVHAALSAARKFATEFDPQVVVALVPDHFNGFFYRLMPPFCLGTAASAVGDYASLAGPLDVPAGLASACAQAVLDEGMDLAISLRMELDHATAQPLRELFGALDARPVIPVFINAAAPPLGPLSRARQLGAAIGRFFARRDERVLLVGSGGLSHDPPVPDLGTAPPPIAERLLSGRPLTSEEAERKHGGAIAEGKRLAAGTSERRPLSPEWDGRFLDLVASGSLRELDAWTNAEIDEHGCGAHEIRTWVAAYAALAEGGPYEVTYRYYRPIPEYIAGFAVTTAGPAADEPDAGLPVHGEEHAALSLDPTMGGTVQRMSDRPIRVVQWTTGNVARQSIAAIIERPDLELVGVYAYSKEKAGRDVGELAGLGRTLGILATDDVEAIIALTPDCVLYMPLHPSMEHLTRLLRAGINVLTTASFLTGRAYGQAARAALDEAARAGNASLFGSGINPGWADQLAAVASAVCRKVEHVTVFESFDIGTWAGDANQDELGWGRPAGDPGHAGDVITATAPFGDALEAMAELLGTTIEDVRCEVDFAHATKDLDIPGRPVASGTVAGLDVRWIGVCGGVDVVEAHIRWTVTADLDPAWEVAMAYLIEIRGHPQVNLRVEVLPQDMASMSLEEMLAIGSVITAMPVVNAIPAVIAARPGIVTYADLPTQASRHVSPTR